jgi:eukaryotic-like serine/threonine-protein kinase
LTDPIKLPPLKVRLNPSEKELLHRALVYLGSFTLVTVVAGAVALGVTKRHEKMIIPRIIGMSQSEAERELSSKGLVLKVDRYATDEHVPGGLVSLQNPRANAYASRGMAVTVTISKGQPKVSVPNVIGNSFPEAQIALAGSRLRAGRESLVTSAETRDTVLAQVPEPGTSVESYSEVNLLVSSGPLDPSYVMPDLKNQPLEKAFKVLRPAGITIEKITNEAHDDLDSETILSQTPPPGTKVQRKDGVSFVVSAKSTDQTQARLSKVVFDMPEGNPRRLQIDVFDGTGTRTIYNKMESPKDHVELEVTVTGKASAQVYLNQEFLKEIPIE